MKCVICKQADVEPGTATVTLERDGTTFVVKHVAAHVCLNCSEEYLEGYLDDDAASRLMETAEQSARSGVQVDVREYAVTRKKFLLCPHLPITRSPVSR